jgi:DNA-binding beta-propeller fold protein YncE
MQSVAVRLGCALALAMILVASGAEQSGAASGTISKADTASQVVASDFIYAAQSDGTIHVYDIDNHHADVKVIRLFSCCADVRGITAAVPTHRLYVMYNRDNQGHVAALDVMSDQVLWDRVLHSPGVDRGDVTPDGSSLYIPTWEDDPGSAYELVIDAETGTEKARITLPPRSHDTIVSLDGQRVFMETKSQTASMYVADTASNQVLEALGGYCCSGVLAPFAINGTGTRVVNQVNGYAGFQLADVAVGGVTASIPFASGGGGHGIAWTPDESQVWVDDGGMPEVHVFDMKASPPQELRAVAVSHVPHWLTFGIDGRFAYVAGRKGSEDATDVIEVSTSLRVSNLGPSEDLLEVDFAGGSLVAVGNQFGIGRITSPAT